MSLRNILLCGAVAMSCATSAGQVLAQTAGASAGTTTIGEVVVTARKKSESLQKIPVAVTSVTGAQLTQRGIRETTDLQAVVPSLTVSINSSQASAAVFSLRGQTAGDILLTLSQPVGVYEDNVNVPHPDGLQGAFFDIQRVEVLKGPQGTLYGRNTTGGAVNIISKSADFNGYHGFATAEVGDYSDWKLGGAINAPLIDDVLSVRLAYQHWSRDGFGKSTTTGETFGDDHDDDLGRISITFDPLPNLSSNTKFEYGNLDRNGYMTKLVALPPFAAGGTTVPLEVGLETGCGSFANIPALIGCGAAALAPYLSSKNIFQNGSAANVINHVKTMHFGEDITWNIDADTKLRSITGYHDVRDNSTLDLAGVPWQILDVGAGAGQVQPIAPFGPYTHPVIPEEAYHSFTQEFNLSGHSFDRLTWLIGAFGSWEEGAGGEPYVALPDLTGGSVSTTTVSNGESTKTWALYTQNDIKISDRIDVTLGARYTSETEANKSQQFNWLGGNYSCVDGTAAPGNNYGACPYASQNAQSNGISYLASFNFQITPDTLIYVKTSRGYRGGALQFRAPSLPGVKPEFATDYEIGVKSDFFEHRLRTNLAGYHTNYINKQETIIETFCGAVPYVSGPCAAGTHSTTVLFNAATAHIDGFEGEFTALPIKGWTINGSLTYLRGVYDKFPNGINADGAPADLTGAPFADPTWRYYIGTRYERPVGPGMLGGQLDWNWRAKTNQNAITTSPLFNEAAPGLQDKLYAAVGLLNGRLDYSLPDKGITVALFATNLLDKHYQTVGLFQAALGIATANTQAPRMFGVTVTKSFGHE
ncbi:MAG TPA: TonB-dependent receptor [Caulobacteraceae bacterium]